jgi:hypothetical protein
MDETSIIVLVVVVLVAFLVLMIASMWTIFTKAGQPGWVAIIPISNAVVFMEIIGKPWWWILLWMIPSLNIIWVIWAWNLMVKSFGKEEGFTIGVIFLGFIFIPILAFGDSQYIGPSGKPIQNHM